MPSVDKHDQHGIFEPLLLLPLRIVDRHQDGGRRAEDGEDFEEPGKAVDNEAAVERHQPALGQQQHDHAGSDKQHDRSGINQHHAALGAKDAKHQQRHGAEAENDFRQ